MKDRMRGGIKAQGRGTWVIVLSLGRDPTTGKYHQRWVSVKGTRKDAEAKRRELVHQLDCGDLIEPSKMTMADFLLNRWLPNHAKNKNLALRTVAGYRDRLERHIIPALGHHHLSELKPVTVEAYYRQSMENGRLNGKGGLSARSVKQHHAILHAALKDAVRWQMISRNPCDAVQPPVFHSPEMRTFDSDEIWRFLGVVKSDYPEYYALFYLLLFSGLRRSEALALTWRDLDLVDPHAGSLSVKRSLHCIKGEIHLSERTKTAKSNRTNGLPGTATLVLREYREKRETIFQDMGMSLVGDDLVFSRIDVLDQNGRPSAMLPDSVTHAWIKAVRRAGLPGVRLHDARHTHASLMLDAGVDISVIQKIEGHSSIRVTTDTYVHAVSALKRKAAQSFDERVSRPREVVNR